jgi:hypothetical protein
MLAYILSERRFRKLCLPKQYVAGDRYCTYFQKNINGTNSLYEAVTFPLNPAFLTFPVVP